jgi:DNA mismatch repair ATPase MutS
MLCRFAEQAEAFFNSMHPKGSDSIESLSIFSRSYHHLCVLGQAISEMRGVFLMEGSDNDPLMIRRGLSLDVDAYSDALENLESILEKWKSEFFASMALIWRGSVQSLQKKILIKGSGVNTVVQCAEDLGPLLEAQGYSCLMRSKKTLQFKVPRLIELAEAVEQGKRSLQQAVFVVTVKLMELYLALYNEFVLLSDSLGEMDALIGLALVTHAAGDDTRFTRPVLTRADPARGLFHEIKLSKVWNPQLSLPEVQGLTKNTSIQPNDVCLGGLEPNAMLLSGENSAGKSTLLRSVCVAVIMAQIGCYVPCERAELCPVDRIMTRMGASEKTFKAFTTLVTVMT